MEAGELKGITTLALSDHESLSRLEQQALESLGNDVVLVSLRGRFSYASARELTKRVGTMAAGYKAIILDMSEAADIDTTAAMAIDDLIRSTQSQGIHCVISGLSGAAEATLRSLGVLKALPAENRVATPMAAIERAEALVTG
jgi:SulP family sulfate permease